MTPVPITDSISSPSITFVTIHVRQSAQSVSLAVATIAAALPQQYKHTSVLIDAYLTECDDEIINRIINNNGNTTAACIAFSMYVWNKQRIIAIASELRQQLSQVVLIVGGPEATACSQQIAQLNLFDYVIAGEGELLSDHINKIITEQHLENHPTIVSQQTKVVDLTRQVSPWLSGILPPTAGVLWEISRGCPFKCAFCYDSRGVHGVREISSERLEQELQLFAEQQVGQVWVLDSTFNYPAQRGKQLLRLIAEYAPDIHFHLEAKAEFLDEETIYLMQQISCSIQVGLQSARPEVLKQINRALNIAIFSEKVQLLSDGGITFGIDLIYGLPNDTLEGLYHSIEYALQFSPNHVEIFPLALLPGTKLYDQQLDFGLVANSEPPYTIQYSATVSAEQMHQCRSIATATDIFYNTGRAMAFFLPLCAACNLSAVDFINKFSCWLDKEQPHWIDKDWSAAQVYELQQEFIPQLFAKYAAEHLTPLAQDLLRFHTGWANTLLGEETLPSDNAIENYINDATTTDSVMHQPWRLAPTVQLESFYYEVAELGEQWEIDLIEYYELVAPCPSHGLFIKRGGEVFCESIDNIFALLLTNSTGQQTPAQIFANIPEDVNDAEFTELVIFAVNEGLLVATKCEFPP